MWRFEFVSHKYADDKVLYAIIDLKNMVWHYPLRSHKQWIDKNLRPEDYHLLLWHDSELAGYLNLVQLKGTTDAWGIGNVVVNPDKQGQNVGYLLMNLCDFFLVQTKTPGMLICKDSVLVFYEKCGWHEFSGNVRCQSEDITNHFLTRHFDNSHYSNIEIDRVF